MTQLKKDKLYDKIISFFKELNIDDLNFITYKNSNDATVLNFYIYPDIKTPISTIVLYVNDVYGYYAVDIEISIPLVSFNIKNQIVLISLKNFYVF